MTYWRDEAACLGTDPDLFFLSTTSPAGQTAEAKEVCAPCPVRGQCLAWAQDTGIEYGVWGGLSEADRRKAAAPKSQPVAPCGTQAAYQRHRRNGEDACDRCRAAHAASRRKLYAAHGAPPATA